MGLDLDNFTEYHLQASKSINDKYLKYTMDELEQLYKLSIDVHGKEPTLMKISTPYVIVGDIHGQYYDLLRMFSFYSNGDVTGALARQYVFLGDYVDRGLHSLECVCLVLALKIRFITHCQVLRVNLESTNINRAYGFLDELLDRFGNPDGQKLWEKFNEVFSWMPFAGLAGSKILCTHGGIFPELKSFNDISKIKRPLPDISVSQLALDLLWADPMPFCRSTRLERLEFTSYSRRGSKRTLVERTTIRRARVGRASSERKRRERWRRGRRRPDRRRSPPRNLPSRSVK